MSEEFKSGKLSRFLSLGTSLTKASAQLALDAAKNKAQDYIDKNPKARDLELKIKASKEIIQTMGELKGAMMKLGQMISISCLLYTSPSPRDLSTSRMPSSA